MATVLGIACGSGAVGAAVFNLVVGSLMATMGEYLFYCMGCLHPIATIVLLKLVKPAEPKEEIKLEVSSQPAC